MMVWMSYVQKSVVGEEGVWVLGEGSTVRGLGDDFAVGEEDCTLLISTPTSLGPSCRGPSGRISGRGFAVCQVVRRKAVHDRVHDLFRRDAPRPVGQF